MSIKEALLLLGYRGRVKIYPAGYGRSTVIVNGLRVGVWDRKKATFVD